MMVYLDLLEIVDLSKHDRAHGNLLPAELD